MPDNILSASVWRREGRKGTLKSSTIYQEAPSAANSTHDGCRRKEGPSWRWWMDEAMPEHLCTRPASLEVVSAQQRRWSGRWNSLLPLFSLFKEKIRIFLYEPLLLGMLECVEIKQGLQKAKFGESWSSPSSNFWCKKYFKVFSQVIPGLGFQFAFTIVGSTHS